MEVILFSLLSASAYYLGSRAIITRAIWSRYPTWLVGFMDCSGCTGFWWGAIIAAVSGTWAPTSYLGMPTNKPIVWPLVGLCSIVLTPIAAGAMQRGLDALGVLSPEPEPEPSVSPAPRAPTTPPAPPAETWEG
jgi:hypothetical protein